MSGFLGLAGSLLGAGIIAAVIAGDLPIYTLVGAGSSLWVALGSAIAMGIEVGKRGS